MKIDNRSKGLEIVTQTTHSVTSALSPANRRSSTAFGLVVIRAFNLYAYLVEKSWNVVFATLC